MIVELVVILSFLLRSSCEDTLPCDFFKHVSTVLVLYSSTGSLRSFFLRLELNLVPSGGCEKQGKAKAVGIEAGLMRTLYQEF